jgi:PhoPQ-activated pathogenicity-related protein
VARLLMVKSAVRAMDAATEFLASAEGGKVAVKHFVVAAVVKESPLPKFRWAMRKDGSITVEAETKPREVNLWQATNPKARDFRLMTIGKAYWPSPLAADDKGAYVGRVAKPESGWTAFFVELVFDSGDDKAPYKFTTQVQVVPDVLPHSFDEFRKTLK